MPDCGELLALARSRRPLSPYANPRETHRLTMSSLILLNYSVHSLHYFFPIIPLLPDIIYVLRHPEYMQPQKSFDKPTEVINQDLYPSELRGVLAFLSKSHIIFIDSFFAAIALSKFSAKDIRFQISSEITLSYG